MPGRERPASNRHRRWKRRGAREIAEEQYRAGTSSSLNVITAQTAERVAELNLVNIQTRQLAASMVLLKNTGGRTSPVD